MSVAKIQRLSNRQRSHRYNKSDYLIGRSHFDDIESKILVAAPDIDLESRLESRYGASKYPQHPRCSRTIIHMKGALLDQLSSQKTEEKTTDFLQKKGCKTNADRCKGVLSVTLKVLTTRMLKDKFVINGKQ